MAPPILRVAPDGVLLDHAAEFAYEPTARIQSLFLHDEEGYIDSVAQLVQTISIGGSIVSSKQKGATQSTDRLKDDLSRNGRLIVVDFFDETERVHRFFEANLWLDAHWEKICGELDNLRSEASIAFLGFMRREFHYTWLREDPQWSAQWYSRPEESKVLPSGVKRHILNEILALASQYGINEPEGMFGNWIDQCATTHFRIFGEYLLFLSASTGYEYMPTLTRSSLRCLRHESEASITDTVFPFIALEAVKKVKHREDLVPRVIEWTEGPGRKTVDGLSELESIVRADRSPERERSVMRDIESILTSEWPREFVILLNLYNLAKAAAGAKLDVEAAKNIAKLAQSNSYRWLWSIRAPEAEAHWRKKVRELVTG